LAFVRSGVMEIRNYQPGDESVQAAIYNAAAGSLPKFKPASEGEVGRRTKASDFDPRTRFYAVAGGEVVGYAMFHANGRVSYPWCRPGQESAAEPLFAEVEKAMKARKMPLAFAAYRGDWTPPREFFLRHGFRLAREMMNFVVDQVELPTRTGKLSNPLSPLTRQDIPAIFALAPEVLRVASPQALEKQLFENPYFKPDSVYVLRSRANNVPLAAGIVIENPGYADPKQVDAAMPCFRLGAFGTEGMQTKRINGLFSFLCGSDRDVNPLALDLMHHATVRLEESEAESLAAQVPSDAPHLLQFYQRYFRRQASFPVYEKAL
jgi:hypothetical protein